MLVCEFGEASSPAAYATAPTARNYEEARHVEKSRVCTVGWMPATNGP